MTTPSSQSLATIQDTLGDWWTGTPQVLPVLCAPSCSTCLPLVPPATPSSMLCAWHNSDKIPVNYPDLLSKFSVCHHKVTMYSFFQVMHSNEDVMTPICARELYYGQ
ncbi:hypothetical protein DSO57_1014012 [Entomophthora muscae]|uniref:Uncharacterized protein n=1 Tax=Entomophthora muscae TaxID=34485 RepID=A0ACC2SIL3_9FUNG|nr:hypothetical protein DSO57_1014012 [Entomophthora muscae]